MVSQISEFLSLNANITENIIYTIFALIIFIALRLITATIIRRNVEDEKNLIILEKLLHIFIRACFYSH